LEKDSIFNCSFLRWPAKPHHTSREDSKWGYLTSQLGKTQNKTGAFALMQTRHIPTTCWEHWGPYLPARRI